ncbi:MAG: 50S ribosomal protein L17 [Acidobacteriota bacterium]
MRHRVAHRKLGRTTQHRLSLLRNLAASLFLHERIRTTLAKAKELRPFAERLVTLGKRDTLHARRQALRIVPRKDAVAKLFNEISPRFADRAGGYTRILKLGTRGGDGAPLAFIQFVDFAFKPEKATAAAKGAEKPKKETKPKKDEEAPAAEAAAEAKAKPAKKTRRGPARAKKTSKKATKKTAKKTTAAKKTTKKASKKTSPKRKKGG